jgi:hypothetical protein
MIHRARIVEFVPGHDPDRGGGPRGRELQRRPGRQPSGFYGVQAGAEFKGTFHKFSAAIDFAPDALATAKFDVSIDLNSTDTKDNDRDKTMRGPDVFDVSRFPTAHYVARSFTKTAAGYSRWAP